LQDLLGMDEQLRNADVDIERINVPAIMPFYWRYRMHLGLDGLAKASGFNARLREMIGNSGR
jgi:4-alpha-glucanotransferase